MGVLHVSLHARLYAEKSFDGLWPHRGKADRGRAESVLHVAGLSAADAAAGSPTVSVRVTVGYWHEAREVHAWLEKKLGGVIDDCETRWLARDVLVELCEQANQLIGGGEDPEGEWASAMIQVSRALSSPRLTGCHWYYEPSF